MPGSTTTPNPAPTFSYSLLTGSSSTAPTADFGSNLKVNFSGQTWKGSNPADFSVGGWIQLNGQTPGSAASVFCSSDQFLIKIYPPASSGAPYVLTAGFGAGNMVVVTTSGNPLVNLNDGKWHFVLVTFSGLGLNAQGQPNGLLSLYVDGLPLDSQLVTTNGVTTTPGDCQLPGSLAFLNFGSWCIWNQCLSGSEVEFPLWGSPAAGVASTGLLAAWDFSNGSLTDVSGNNCPILSTNGTQSWYIPALYNSGGGSAQPDAQDGLNPGGNGAFSVTMWAYPIQNVAYGSGTLLLNQGGTGFQAFRISVYAGQCTASFEQPPLVPGTPGTVKSQVSSGLQKSPLTWYHIAVTYDGKSTLTLYLNGKQVDQNTSAQPLTMTNPGVYISSDQQTQYGYNGYIQGLTIWTTCLDAADVVAYMASDPSSQPGCVGLFPFVADMNNVITGRPCATKTFPGNTPVSIGTLLLPVADASPPPVPPPPVIPPFLSMTPSEVTAAAAAMGIDTTTVPEASDAAGALSPQDIDYLNSTLASLPASLRQKIISQFQLNYSIGYQLAAKGTPLGTFSNEVQGSKAVFSYHTAAGPQVVGALDLTGAADLSDDKTCQLQLFLDGMVVVLSVVGVRYSPTKLFAKVLEIFEKLLCIAGAFKGLVDDTKGGTTKPGLVEIAHAIYSLLGCIVSQLFALIWNAVLGTWWSFASTVISVVATITGMIVSGGAALLIKLAFVGFAVGELVYHLMNKPCK